VLLWLGTHTGGTVDEHRLYRRAQRGGGQLLQHLFGDFLLQFSFIVPLKAGSTPRKSISIARPLLVMVAVAGPWLVSQGQSMDRRLVSPRVGKVATIRATLKPNAPI
jgi:hypothetical protein